MKSNIHKNSISQLIADSMKDEVQKMVVGAVICRDGKFLLLERLSSDFLGGLVELPSGTVDKGEDLLAALAREVQEETGLEVTTILKYIGLFDYTSGSGKKTRQFNFLVETAPGEISLEPTEHQAYYLIAPAEEAINTLYISDETKEVIRTAALQ